MGTTSMIPGPGRVGIGVPNWYGYAFNRTGSTLAIGEVLQIDMTSAAGEFAPNAQLGHDDHILGNLVVATAASATVPGIGGEVNATTIGQPSAIFVLVIGLGDGGPAGSTPGGDNAIVRVLVAGVGHKIKPKSGESLTVGRHFFAEASVLTVTNTLVKGKKSLGWATATSSAADALTDCVFDGWHGFGTAPLDLLA
jgi:hypothetical protein